MCTLNGCQQSGGSGNREHTARALTGENTPFTVDACCDARCSVGGAQFCLDNAREYTKARQQFGGPISSFQATQFKVADMATSVQVGAAGVPGGQEGDA